MEKTLLLSSYFEACILIVIINLTFRGLNTVPNLNQELFWRSIKELASTFIERFSIFIEFDIQKYQPDMFDNRENQMVSPIVPIMRYLLSQVKLPCFNVDIRVINFTDEVNLWGFVGELIKKHFELKFGIFEEPKPHKYYPMPY